VLNFFLGLLSGILATLIAGNHRVRFSVERKIRTIFKSPLVKVALSMFEVHCKGGMLLLHCMELRSAMWFTPLIPQVYFLSYGPWSYDSHAYKPFVYFRYHGLFDVRTDVTPSQLLAEYGSNIIPHIPDEPRLSINISREVPRQVVVICESIDNLRQRSHGKTLNHVRIVGKLHAAVANPMPMMSPGASWNLMMISEEFGLVDNIRVGIPSNLKKLRPFGDSVYAIGIKERPPCLLDIARSGMTLTWPLRLEIQDRRFKKPLTVGKRKKLC
jgi:hypothetical protein